MFICSKSSGSFRFKITTASSKKKVTNNDDGSSKDARHERWWIAKKNLQILDGRKIDLD